MIHEKICICSLQVICVKKKTLSNQLQKNMYILTLKKCFAKSYKANYRIRWGAHNKLHPKRGAKETLTTVSSGKWNYREENVKNRASTFMFHVLLYSFSLWYISAAYTFKTTCFDLMRLDVKLWANPFWKEGQLICDTAIPSQSIWTQKHYSTALHVATQLITWRSLKT